VELFFVLAVLQIAIATVLIADHQRLQVGRQVASQSLGVRSPNRIDHSPSVLVVKVLQSLCISYVEFDGGIVIFEPGNSPCAILGTNGRLKFPSTGSWNTLYVLGSSQFSW